MRLFIGFRVVSYDKRGRRNALSLCETSMSINIYDTKSFLSSVTYQQKLLNRLYPAVNVAYMRL